MDNGNHFQYEVASGDEIYHPEVDSLKTAGAKCRKNPGHEQFIAVKDFGLCHLPIKYQHEDWLKYVRIRSDLTVLVKTKVVSPTRPDKFPGSKFRGEKMTQKIKKCGNLREVQLATEHDGSTIPDDFCRCSDCKQSPQPKSSWWEIYVQSAAHVVCDDIEAANTDVVFFYDETDSQAITIPGHRVQHTDVKKDDCDLVCVVHDGEINETLEQLSGLIDSADSEERNLEEKYPSLWRDLCVIISHPHGNTKKISVGKHLGNDLNNEGFLLRYTTATCPGSSGADVGLSFGGLGGLSHSVAARSGVGRSARM